MDPSVVGIVGSALGLAGVVYGGVSARKKIKAEAESFLVDQAQDVVAMAMGQLEYVQGQLTQLQNSVNDYRTRLENATRQEFQLRMEVGKLKKRVSDLEEALKFHNLPIPEETT